MRWDRGHESPDVIDERGQGSGGGGGLLWAFLPILLRSPFGWLILVVLFVAWLARGTLMALMGPSAESQATRGTHASADTEVQFVSFVLDDAQTAWRGLLAQRGVAYRNAKLVLFTDETRTGCGFGDAATGPFYCPSDERVYIDLGFFRELAQRFGAKGEFAQAYVIAHEIGHHVQKVLGIEARVAHARGPSEGAQGSSVRLELQADCFAGIWARTTENRNLLEAGDIESALNAAAAIGDDRLQREATGVVQPERWTHGSSAERVRWFKRGFASGSIDACDTFSALSL
jgi:predicted metalloprotease